MMAYQTFLEWCATELCLIKELTALCLERILDVLDVLLSAGTVEYVWMGGCEWLTPPMGSPRLYEELVQPFEQKVIERIHAGGAISHIHCHGNVRSTLEAVVERGADFFEPVEPPPDGDITFAEAKRLAAGRMVLGGNVEVRIVENEGADVVEAVTREAFEGGKEHMVLKLTEAPLSRIRPQVLANYHRFIDVWEELSPLQA
jgi:uroporphyrinogen-III decarboxylase